MYFDNYCSAKYMYKKKKIFLTFSIDLSNFNRHIVIIQNKTNKKKGYIVVC